MEPRLIKKTEWTPELLFAQNIERAEEIARKLCWLYRVSGAQAYQDEAASEALLALWKCACRFNPSQQAKQKIKAKVVENEFLWALILDHDPPVYSIEDPYQNFFMWAVKRIRGSVLDLFRSEKLIIKRSLSEDLAKLTKAELASVRRRLWETGNEEEVAAELGIDVAGLKQLRPTMLHQERFISTDKILFDAKNGGSGDTVGDMIASNVSPLADLEYKEEQAHIVKMKDDAHLTEQERRVVDISFSEDGYTKSEVAKIMWLSVASTEELLRQALNKIRAAATSV